MDSSHQHHDAEKEHDDANIIEPSNSMTMMHHHNHGAAAATTAATADDHQVFDAHGNLMLANDKDDEQQHVFCKAGMGGGGMIMYMDGFRSSLLAGGGTANKPCLNLLFPGWTLDSRFKFGSACVGVFVLAFFVEGLSKMRHRLVRWVRYQQRQQQQQQQQQSSLSCPSLFHHPTLLRLSVTTLHGLQALLGYVLMLVTMTFSIELLLCVVLGLAAGYFAMFFPTTTPAYYNNSRSDDTPSNNNNNNNDEEEFPENIDEDLHVTSNPCCEFMAEESREQQQPAAVGGGTRRRTRWTSSSNNNGAAVAAAGGGTENATETSSLTAGLLAADGGASDA